MPPSLLRALVALLLLVSPAVLARHEPELMAPATDRAPKPAADTALVVFLRPRFFGGEGGWATVFDAPDTDTTFLGAVEYRHKLAVQLAPGRHRLMVIGESADFLDAELEAGKTYYVAVKVHPGWRDARFTLVPVHNDPAAKYCVQCAGFREWNSTTTFQEMSPAAQSWYAQNQARIEALKAEYLPKWNAKPPEDRAERLLEARDGL
jgi:hypothetical protein